MQNMISSGRMVDFNALGKSNPKYRPARCSKRRIHRAESYERICHPSISKRSLNFESGFNLPFKAPDRRRFKASKGYDRREFQVWNFND